MSDIVAVIELIRVFLAVCNIMSEDSDSTLNHGGLFKGGRTSVYKERSFAVGGFPLLLSLLHLLYTKTIDNFGNTTLKLWSCLVVHS